MTGEELKKALARLIASLRSMGFGASAFFLPSCMGSLAVFPDFFLSERLDSAASGFSGDFCSLPPSEEVFASAGFCSAVAAGFVSLEFIGAAAGV